MFERGRIARIDTPAAVHDRPRSRFVAQFVGETNLLEAGVERVDADALVLRLAPDWTLRAALPAGRWPAGDRAVVSIRPERIEPGRAAANRVDARLEDVVYQGDHTRLHLARGSLSLVSRVPRGLDEPSRGDVLSFGIEVEHCTVFAA